MPEARMRWTLGLCVVPAICACLGAPAGTEPLPPGGLHVLFVGNSLTYTNDLPATVAAIAAGAGDTVRVSSATAPDLALIDHLTGGSDALARIQSERWDYVVLQQGPTTIGLCRDSLILWTRMFDPLIRAAHGRPALLMVWPIGGSQVGFDRVHLSFALAAQVVNGAFLPAGEAWRAAFAEDSTLPLYGGDHFHPAAMGSYLAALTIYERLSGRDARTLPAQYFSAGVAAPMPEATIRLLQRAAHRANLESPEGAVVTDTSTVHSPPAGGRC